MVIDIFTKNKQLFKPLEIHNQMIWDIDKKYPSPEVSWWFFPEGVRKLWLGRTYPESCEAQMKEEYCLILHASNYLTLFLTDLFYSNRKDIVIEDFGCGDGRLFVYLNFMGFKHFSGWDDWSQLPYPIYGDMMRTICLNPKLNNPNTHPVVVNNSHAPFVFITYGFDDREDPRGDGKKQLHPNRDISSVELATFNANSHWENELAPIMLPKRGFRFLCKDSDDLAVAWCREDKYNEFIEKIKEYEVK